MPKLYGDIIKGKEFMSFEFTDKDFSNHFGKEDKFKIIIAKGLKEFDIKLEIKPNKKNENIIIVSEKIVFVIVSIKQTDLTQIDIKVGMITQIG